MYRIAICEDDPGLRAQLSDLCRKILTRLEVEHSLTPFASAQALKKALAAGDRFDLLCLDILMPGQNGMEFAQELRRHDDQTSILFVTSSTDYLQEGYSVQPIQYLLKPVKEEMLDKALQTDLRLRNRTRTVTVTVGKKVAVILLADIQYIESRDHKSVFILKNGESEFWIPLSQVEKMLPAAQFCRCHNSFLVNLAEVVRMDSRDVLLTGGKKLSISRNHSAEFQKRLTRYLNGI